MFAGRNTGEIVLICILTFFIVDILLIIILLCVKFFCTNPRRRAVFRRIAENLGVDFSSKSTLELESVMYASGAWDCPDSFTFGLRNRKIKNVIHNMDISCGKMTVFDYHGLRNNRRYSEPSFFPFVCTCAFVSLPAGVDFPYCLLTPADWTSRLSYKLFGETEPGLENYPEFAQKYNLSFPRYEDDNDELYEADYDKRLQMAEKMFTPAVIEAIGEKKNITIYFNKRWIVYCIGSGATPVKNEDLESFIADARNIVQNLYSAIKN
ncbi:MAG: hypothetical protein J6Z08_04460 [Elusimicrobiales bacterium]|nr:hypothetical protein [Elusimicrobiales bacterium]